MSDTSKKQSRTTKAKSATTKPASATRVNARKTVRKTTLKVASKAASKKVKPVSASKAPPKKQANLVRDSFSIPENEYALLAETKKNCLKAGFEIKKSEIIRIGISLVHQLTLARLKKAQKVLQPVKTGRPKKFK